MEMISFGFLRLYFHEGENSFSRDHFGFESGWAECYWDYVIIEGEDVGEEQSHQGRLSCLLEKCNQDGNWADDEAEQSQPEGKPALKCLPGDSYPFVDLNPINLLIHEPIPCPIRPDSGQPVDGWDKSTDNRRVSFCLYSEGLSLGFHVVNPEVVAEEEDDEDGDDH